MDTLRAERDKQIAALFEDGQTIIDIAKHFGLTKQRVQQILSLFGYTRWDGGAHKHVEARQRERQERLDKESLERYGFPRAKMTEFRRSGVLHKFITQRKHATERGIGWELSFSQWFGAWQQSGRWDDRGRGSGFCMARKGDKGPYSLGNIYFCTGVDNARDSYVFTPVEKRKRRTSWAHLAGKNNRVDIEEPHVT